MKFPSNASKQQKCIVWQYVANFLAKNCFYSQLYPFTGLFKNSCLNKSKISYEFALFKHGKKNKHSEYFSARF